MKSSLLPHLVCPASGEPLSLAGDERWIRPHAHQAPPTIAIRIASVMILPGRRMAENIGGQAVPVASRTRVADAPPVTEMEDRSGADAALTARMWGLSAGTAQVRMAA